MGDNEKTSTKEKMREDAISCRNSDSNLEVDKVAED